MRALMVWLTLAACGESAVLFPAPEVVELPETETAAHLDYPSCGDEGSARGSCYTGPSGTSARSPCHPGVEVCRFGAWTCEGERTPAEEACDGSGADEDCDGEVDEGFESEAPEVVVLLDWSSSMAGDWRAVEAIVDRLSLIPGVRLALVNLPGSRDGVPELALRLGPKRELRAYLAARGDRWAGGLEPSLDAVWMLATGYVDPGWSRGPRYQVLLSDEPGQSYLEPEVTETEAAEALAASGQRLIGLTLVEHFGSYDAIAARSGGALFSLADGDQAISSVRAVRPRCVP